MFNSFIDLAPKASHHVALMVWGIATRKPGVLNFLIWPRKSDGLTPVSFLKAGILLVWENYLTLWLFLQDLTDTLQFGPKLHQDTGTESHPVVC